MSLKITIFSGAESMLDEIAKANYGQGLDALDHAGTKLRESQRAAMLASRTPISRYYDKGKLVIVNRGRKKVQQVLGQRISHKNKGGMADPSSMSSFITSNLIQSSMTMVVGGKHKDLHPKTWRDGKVVGVQKKVGAVTKYSYAILQKLDSGDAEINPDYKKIYKNPLEAKIFEKAKFRKQNFMEKGYASAKGQIEGIMTNKLEQMIHKQVNRATVYTKEVRTA